MTKIFILDHEYLKWRNKAKKIITKYEQLARTKGITENFGEKDYRKFQDAINNSFLSYADKATLCAFLSESLSTIK